MGLDGRALNLELAVVAAGSNSNLDRRRCRVWRMPV